MEIERAVIMFVCCEDEKDSVLVRSDYKCTLIYGQDIAWAIENAAILFWFDKSFPHTDEVIGVFTYTEHT
jgi:hypothetical protein